MKTKFRMRALQLVVPGIAISSIAIVSGFGFTVFAMEPTCPCDVPPAQICNAGDDCSALPSFNYDDLRTHLLEFAGDGEISCGNNFSDITASAGIRNGSEPGSLSVRAEIDKGSCSAIQRYRDDEGNTVVHSYFLTGYSESEIAQCSSALHRVCGTEQTISVD